VRHGPGSRKEKTVAIRHSLAMIEAAWFPRNIIEFEEMFGSEANCVDYLRSSNGQRGFAVHGRGAAGKPATRARFASRNSSSRSSFESTSSAIGLRDHTARYFSNNFVFRGLALNVKSGSVTVVMQPSVHESSLSAQV
jgi:hypothetical protein